MTAPCSETPSPHAARTVELQEGLLSTVVPPPTIPVTQDIQDLVDCAARELETGRVQIRLRAEAFATGAGCEHTLIP